MSQSRAASSANAFLPQLTAPQQLHLHRHLSGGLVKTHHTLAQSRGHTSPTEAGGEHARPEVPHPSPTPPRPASGHLEGPGRVCDQSAQAETSAFSNSRVKQLVPEPSVWSATASRTSAQTLPLPKRTPVLQLRPPGAGQGAGQSAKDRACSGLHPAQGRALRASTAASHGVPTASAQVRAGPASSLQAAAPCCTHTGQPLAPSLSRVLNDRRMWWVTKLLIHRWADA